MEDRTDVSVPERLEKSKLFNKFLQNCGPNLRQLHINSRYLLLNDDHMTTISEHCPNFDSLKIFSVYNGPKINVQGLVKIAENCHKFPRKLRLDLLEFSNEQSDNTAQFFTEKYYSRLEKLHIYHFKNDNQHNFLHLCSAKHLDPHKIKSYKVDYIFSLPPIIPRKQFAEFIEKCTVLKQLMYYRTAISPIDLNEEWTLKSDTVEKFEVKGGGVGVTRLDLPKLKKPEWIYQHKYVSDNSVFFPEGDDFGQAHPKKVNLCGVENFTLELLKK